ncbi:MAG: malonyl-ACP O-methyltransferase BioC [Gammaproteobacteria bacterium]
MITDGYQRDGARIRRNFDTAAAGYDKVAQLQRVVGTRLLERLDHIRIKPALSLDLGSGTGFVGRHIAARYRRGRVIQLDCAPNMLRQARQQARWFFSRQRYVCADAEFLPLRDTSIDLAVSNLMLQWVVDPQRSLQECLRVLQPGGLFLFSSFGPDTLSELRQSWRAVDDHIHVNAFMDMHDIGDGMIRAGFTEPVLETERFTLLYQDVRSLLQELKSLGASNTNLGQRKSLTTPAMLKRMTEAYQRQCSEATLPATFEVVYGHAWVPQHQQQRRQAAGDSVAIPLSAIKHRDADGS